MSYASEGCGGCLNLVCCPYGQHPPPRLSKERMVIYVSNQEMLEVQETPA